MNILRATPEQLADYGCCIVRHLPPTSGLSSLTAVDLVSLNVQGYLPMQQHRDAEVFTYLWRGSMRHQDSNGESVTLSATRVMLVNAGEGVQYDVSVPLTEVALLQALVRPAQPGGEAMTQVLERDQGIMTHGWTELAGPETSDAPLELQQALYIYDTLLLRDQTLTVPSLPGFIAYLVVLEGTIRLGDSLATHGDAIQGLDASHEIVGESDANLVCFLIQPDNPG